VPEVVESMHNDLNYRQRICTGRLSVSIGICAYNEEANIGELLKSIQRQKTDNIEIIQIIVVSSACSDGTNRIVEGFKKVDPRIELIQETIRNGKASAINLFLLRATGDVCLLANADTILTTDAVRYLCNPFFNQDVGMTGGRPIPINDYTKFMGFTSNLIWRLAHELSLSSPKLGEFVAFRNVVRHIPDNSTVDEAYIESELNSKGYRIEYVPEAIVYNKGPDTLSDYIKQRRRIYAGHLELSSSTGYQVSSMNHLGIARLLHRTLSENWRHVVWTLSAVILECYARILGFYDFKCARKNLHIWDIASSTKMLATAGSDQEKVGTTLQQRSSKRAHFNI
jgi:cellulose synthase/poly-beta-1,6-N-acetylglucosamine synthase-like glycosyltransferase